MHKRAGIDIVDDNHTFDMQIGKWVRDGKTWFTLYVPTCEKDEFTIPAGQEKDIAHALRQMADILDENK